MTSIGSRNSLLQASINSLDKTQWSCGSLGNKHGIRGGVAIYPPLHPLSHSSPVKDNSSLTFPYHPVPLMLQWQAMPNAKPLSPTDRRWHPSSSPQHVSLSFSLSLLLSPSLGRSLARALSLSHSVLFSVTLLFCPSLFPYFALLMYADMKLRAYMQLCVCEQCLQSEACMYVCIFQY
jgi:hypothetical protein